MPNVTGRIIKASGTAGGQSIRVRFRLVDSSGNRVYQAWDTTADRVIVDQEDFGLDAEGDYTVTLTPNSQIEPANTLWQRVVVIRGSEGPTRSLIMPVGGGPYDEHDILADPVDALPDPAPTNIIDSAEITSSSGALSVNAFALTPVPNLSVTVPDIPEPVLLRLTAPVKMVPSRTQSVTTTSGQATITATSGLVGADTGRTIAGTGIPTIARVLSVQSGTGATMSANATASATVTATISGGIATGGLAIADEPTPSIGEQLNLGWVQTTGAGGVSTAVCEVHLEPHTPGTFYVVAYSLDTGTLTVDASGVQPARLDAIRYGAAV